MSHIIDELKNEYQLWATRTVNSHMDDIECAVKTGRKSLIIRFPYNGDREQAESDAQRTGAAFKELDFDASFWHLEHQERYEIIVSGWSKTD